MRAIVILVHEIDGFSLCSLVAYSAEYNKSSTDFGSKYPIYLHLYTMSYIIYVFIVCSPLKCTRHRSHSVSICPFSFNSIFMQTFFVLLPPFLCVSYRFIRNYMWNIHSANEHRTVYTDYVSVTMRLQYATNRTKIMLCRYQNTTNAIGCRNWMWAKERQIFGCMNSVLIYSDNAKKIGPKSHATTQKEPTLQHLSQYAYACVCLLPFGAM